MRPVGVGPMSSSTDDYCFCLQSTDNSNPISKKNLYNYILIF